MKQQLALLTVLAVAVASIWIAGCATHNPNYNPNLPPGPTNEPFSVDPRINSLSNQVSQLTHAVAPMNPYAGATDWAVNLGFGAVALVSGIFAGIKNKQAGAAANALGVIADGVVKAGAGQAVLDHASTTDHFVTVATAINASTGANQTSTGAQKT